MLTAPVWNCGEDKGMWCGPMCAISGWMLVLVGAVLCFSLLPDQYVQQGYNSLFPCTGVPSPGLVPDPPAIAGATTILGALLWCLHSSTDS